MQKQAGRAGEVTADLGTKSHITWVVHYVSNSIGDYLWNFMKKLDLIPNLLYYL
jgi:hypothetical protein